MKVTVCCKMLDDWEDTNRWIFVISSPLKRLCLHCTVLLLTMMNCPGYESFSDCMMEEAPTMFDVYVHPQVRAQLHLLHNFEKC